MTAIRRFFVCCLILNGATMPIAVARATAPANPGDRLAYVSGGRLYVGFPTARLIPGPGNAFQPEFSHDGRWLVFLRQQWHGYAVSSRLWLARADGSAARVVSPATATSVDSFQWSPTTDVLAAQFIGARNEFIRLIRAEGTVQALPERLHGSFLWMSDGQTLAVAATSRSGHTRLELVRGTSILPYQVPGIGRFDPIKLAAWWPAAHSIVYWLDRGGCFSCIADGTPLYAFSMQTGKTRRLGVGLIYRDWVSISGTRLLAVTGRDRSAFHNKRLVLCTTTSPCRTLRSNRPGEISLEPAWDLSGGPMGFVVAPNWNTDGFRSGAAYRHWLDAHVLWTAQPDGSEARSAPVGVPKGVQSPVWTRIGRGILFVKDGTLWLDPHIGAANAHPIARLIPANAVPNLQNPAYQGWYYGHMNWHDLFAWY